MKNKIYSVRKKLLPLGLFFLAASTRLPATIVTVDRPGMDFWAYDNGFNRGFRENAPIFSGPVGTNGSDDRLAQLVLGWNTVAAGIPAGLGLVSYAITRVTFRATHVNEATFQYDPTYDSYRTHLDAEDPDSLADLDVGRPLELSGLGLRNGFTNLGVPGSTDSGSFGESSGFSTGTGEHTRNAFAYSPDSPRADGDVSENVTERFEFTPFATGTTDALSPGDFVPADTEFTFHIDLSQPATLDYFRKALRDGELGLSLSSLHPASFGGTPGAQTYPRFYTRDYYDFVPEVVPQLEIEYSIVPEPNTASLLILTAASLTCLRTLRRREFFS